MKQITVFNFYELPADVQEKVVKDNHEHINNLTSTYMQEIWLDHVDSLIELPHFNVPTMRSAGMYVEHYLDYASFDESEYAMTADEVREVLNDIRKTAEEKQLFFMEEVLKACDEYAGEPLPVFMHKFFDKLFADATEWMTKMHTDASFAYTYITSDMKTTYSCPDTYFEGWNFLEDGTVITIG